jgi:hypothetical protein
MGVRYRFPSVLVDVELVAVLVAVVVAAGCGIGVIPGRISGNGSR